MPIADSIPHDIIPSHVTRVTSPADLPSPPRHAYHVTPVEDAASILETGIQPGHTTDKWHRINTYLERVAAAEDVTTKPDNRANSTFCYTSRKRGTDPTVHLSGYVTVAIDLTTVEAPIYTASYGAATGVYRELQHCSADVPSVPPADADGTPEARAYDAAVEYWGSLHEYTPTTQSDSDTASELLIPATIAPSAFTHVLVPTDGLRQLRD